MTINNPALYNAVIAGTTGGAQDRWITQDLATDYSNFRAAVLAVASSVDAAIATLPGEPGPSSINLMQSITQGIFSSRFPQSVSSDDYEAISNAIAAVWTEVNAGLDPDGDPGSDCTTVNGFTVADIQAAIDTDANEICFPPGEYLVDDEIVNTLDGQILNFYPGAILVMDPNGLGQLSIEGAGAQILGSPVVRFNVTSAVAYVAVDLNGQYSNCNTCIKFEVNANVANCTLLRMSGDNTKLTGIVVGGSGGSFKYGVEMSDDDGTVATFCRAGSFQWEMEDDGINTRTFSAWFRMRATRSIAGPFNIDIGARHFFNAIIETDGTANMLIDPQISSSQASNYGILMKDDAEFLSILNGHITGNYKANSVGIACGDGSKVSGAPAVGQLKLYNTKVLNWDKGIVITGTCDTPELFGATIANNKVAQIEIDSQRGADIWPISGFGMYGVYSEEVAFPGAPFLHLKSGALEGGVISGSEIGYTGTAVLVEAAMSTNIMEFLGSRFPSANGATDAVTTPNTNSQFYFGRNSQNGSALKGKGAFAAKATSIDDIVCTTLVANTSLKIGSLGDDALQINYTFATANFGAGIPANDMVELAFTWAHAATTRLLTFSVSGALGVPTALTYTCYCPSAGNIILRARNHTGVAVGAISGTIFFCSTKII